MSVRVQLDNSFINSALKFLEHPSERLLDQLIQHTAAQRVHSHATRWDNTHLGLREFWKTTLQRESTRGAENLQKIRVCLEFLEKNRPYLSEAIDEVLEYLPRKAQLDCHLYMMLGYDAGIVCDGDALINLGYPLYHEDQREIIYLAMHELHHVGYISLQPSFSLEELKTTPDLLRAIQYSTHLEGMAVYAPLRRRIQENGLQHEDYPALLNPNERQDRVQQYFDLVTALAQEPNRLLTKADLKIFEIMSGMKKRLWYITGAHMAQSIDEKLGRKELVQTIVNGPETFFKAYETLQE